MFDPLYKDSEYLKKFKYPFDTKNLPKKMETLSSLKNDERLKFFDLIKHRIAFDYLLGIYVCVFKRKGWSKNLHIIDYEKIKDKNSWSNSTRHMLVVRSDSLATKSKS